MGRLGCAGVENSDDDYVAEYVEVLRYAMNVNRRLLLYPSLVSCLESCVISEDLHSSV